VRRRAFITLLGGAAAWPLAARAQQTKVYRIGALVVGNADVHSLRTELREALRKSGYVEGQNLLFEFRSAEEQLDRLPRLATELVALKVYVIVAIYTPCALAAQRATREIPIVIVSERDHAFLADRLANNRERLLADFAIKCEIVGAKGPDFRPPLESLAQHGDRQHWQR
jgi:ABC-type uncharacterized transport system substrate-binding protein